MARPTSRTRGYVSADGGFASLDVIVALSGTGAPTDGTSGTGAGKAGPGSIYVRTSNGRAYRNENTKASPTWTIIPNA